jgi:hypothetical protein
MSRVLRLDRQTLEPPRARRVPSGCVGRSWSVGGRLGGVIAADFIANQLGFLETHDYVRVWKPEGDRGLPLIEIERREEEDQFFVVMRAEVSAGNEVAINTLGFEGVGSNRVIVGIGAVVELASELMVLLLGGANLKVSITHGSRRDQVMTDRKLSQLKSASVQLMAEAFGVSPSRDDPTLLPFRVENVDVSVWPKAFVDGALVEVWALVARDASADEATVEYVASVNSSFTFGRLVMQERLIWFREVVHAEPFSAAAVSFAVTVAVNTAKDSGTRLAQLGATNATLPDPAPADQPAPPDRGSGPYL